MATEEAKKTQTIRLLEFYVIGLSGAIWNFVGDAALALRTQVGEQILKVMEKEMGLELAGEEPEHVLQEISRLLVDEFGIYSSVEVATSGHTTTLKAKDAAERKVVAQLSEQGVEKIFISPLQNIGLAAVRRLGKKAQSTIEPWPAGNGFIVTFDLV